MANKEDAERTPSSAAAAKVAAPVIRRLQVAEDNGTSRIMHRHVPACVISGLFHLVLIFALIFIDKWLKQDDGKGKEKELKAATTNTKMDDPPPPPDDNLTNIDPGLDSDLQAAVENVEIEKEFNVEAPVVEGEPSGLPTEMSEFIPPVTSTIGSLTDTLAAPGAIGQVSDSGVIASGQAGRGGELAMPGLNGRSGATKDKLLKSGGGNKDTERAVALGLAWLAKQQNAAGYWEFDGNHKSDRIAATGLCLLPFLAAGETHMSGKEPKYRQVVAKGIAFLKKELKNTGQFGNSGMYSQPIATIALCEAAGMTQDKPLANAAKAAVDFIVKAQGGNGSWGYTAGTEGDTSIVGWNVQALKSGRLAGLSVPDKAFKQAEAFLKSVASDSEASYGYRGPGATHTLSAVGLLCRQYLGWAQRNPSLARGVRNLVDKFPPQKNDFNMYYYYYASQVVHFFDGDDWHVKWNPVMRDMLLTLQVTEKSPNPKAADIGSWPKDNHFIGSECGKLGTTALAVLTLEVYYRHLPLYKRDSAGLQELERGNQ